jgi:hypothetical protein
MGAGIRTLQWNLTSGSRTVQCTNCAYLSKSMKKIVKEVLAGSVGTWVASINGYDPSITAPADNRGLGWAAEFLVSSPAGGNAIADWILKCSSASSCRSNTLKVSEMLWSNRYWGIETSCTEKLKDHGPTMAYPSADMSTSDQIERREFAIDRVRLGAAEYLPAYERSGDVRRLIGWRETGCAS